MTGITFTDSNNLQYHTYTRWGLGMTSMDIGLPEVKSHKIDLPGADGVRDMSEIFGRVLYGNRKLVFTFDHEDRNYTTFLTTLTSISECLHGKYMKVVLDLDPDYYYEGRVTVEHTKDDQVYSIVTITVDAQPYKTRISDPTVKKL